MRLFERAVLLRPRYFKYRMAASLRHARADDLFCARKPSSKRAVALGRVHTIGIVLAKKPCELKAVCGCFISLRFIPFKFVSVIQFSLSFMSITSTPFVTRSWGFFSFVTGLRVLSSQLRPKKGSIRPRCLDK